MLIVPKGNSGFLYQIKIDGLAIEQNMVGPMAERPMDIGTRSIQLPKTPEGLGMTLRNNPHRTGVVVWTVEEGRAAATAGLRVGDVVLSVEDHLIDSIGNPYLLTLTHTLDLALALPLPLTLTSSTR